MIITYTHWKHATQYVIIGLAHLEATHEPVVIYAPTDNIQTLWVRPASEFFGEVVDSGGSVVRRFKPNPARR